MVVMLASARPQTEAVKLPVCQVKAALTVGHKIGGFVDVLFACDVDILRTLVEVSVAAFFDPSCKFDGVERIAAPGAEPQTEATAEGFGQITGRIKLVRELRIEAPEVLLIIVPAVVDNIAVKRL